MPDRVGDPHLEKTTVKTQRDRNQPIWVINTCPQPVQLAKQFVEMSQCASGFGLAELHLLRVAEFIETLSAGRAHDGSCGARLTSRRTIGAAGSGGLSSGGGSRLR